MKYRIDQISGVKFGTSGARGLVSDLTDQACYLYTIGFLQYVRRAEGAVPPHVAIAGDLRKSTPRILKAVAKAVVDSGSTPIDCGKVPSPVAALYGLTKKIPSVMVTGSHIPDDRNGLKFNLAGGEILKKDESGIKAEVVDIRDAEFDSKGMFLDGVKFAAPVSDEPTAKRLYLDRFLKALPGGVLQGMRIGYYEHSAVGRDLLPELYESLGAKVTRLGRTDVFMPVDTEAVRPEDLQLARQWASGSSGTTDLVNPRFDAILSTDGDSDRPLLFDELGQWVRGDTLGILTARYLAADCVVTPVSSSSALERCKWFPKISRTKIGSPYVVEAMNRAVESGCRRVVGFEANGGFFTALPMMIDEWADSPLTALPTRDPAIVHIAALCMAKGQGVPVSTLVEHLPRRYVMSDRITNVSSLYSQQKLEELILGGTETLEETFKTFGELSGFDTTDGLRMFFGDNDIVHLRPSGNAPEFRLYTESDTRQSAERLLRNTMEIVGTWKIR